MTPPLRCVLAVFTVLVGCSDYSFAEKGSPEQGGDGDGTPDVRVDPAELTADGICGTTQESLIIASVGDSDLTVTDVRVDGTGWRVDTAALPATLAPGTSLELPVTGGIGEATLHVDSTDPDQPTVSIPAAGTGDTAPTVAFLNPSEGDILPVGGSTLQVTVEDSEDALSDVALTWSSNIDGTFSTATADSAGTATAPWVGRSEGPHTLTVQAQDSCGNIANTTVGVCQDAGYTSDELDLAAWHFEGSASWDTTNDWLELTPVTREVVGSAFATDSEVSGDNVEIRFEFYIGDGTGADGLSLTALDTTRMTGFLGGSGCGIGYGGDASCTEGPALPGWSIEVDTWYNAGQDPTEADHVMFTFDGDVDDPAVWAELPEMEDNGWHTMVVTVVAPRVTVEIDGVTYLDDDLSGSFAFPAYVGFTAGTGGSTNRHLINSLEVTESVCGD